MRSTSQARGPGSRRCARRPRDASPGGGDRPRNRVAGRNRSRCHLGRARLWPVGHRPHHPVRHLALRGRRCR